MVRNTSSSQDASTHQIWNSYLKKYKRYAPDTIILKTRSEIKVTVTLKLYATLPHPKMHPHIKFGIPTSKNIGDMHRTRSGTNGQTDIAITIKIKSEVKVTVTWKWYTTLRHPKMHPHTKFEIPTSKNIGVMHRTRSGTDGRTVWLLYASQSSLQKTVFHSRCNTTVYHLASSDAASATSAIFGRGGVLNDDRLASGESTSSRT